LSATENNQDTDTTMIDNKFIIRNVMPVIATGPITNQSKGIAHSALQNTSYSIGSWHGGKL